VDGYHLFKGTQGRVKLKDIIGEEQSYFVFLFSNLIQTVLNPVSIVKVITIKIYTLIILSAKYALSSSLEITPVHILKSYATIDQLITEIIR